MKKTLLVCALALISSWSYSQNRYFTKNGKVHFDCTSPSSPENIIGINDKVSSVIDASTGALEFAILMKAFSFEKALMQEHFNENYVESDKFPKATFKGTVSNMNIVNLSKDGSYPVTVIGMMTLHGVSKEITSGGNLTVKGGSIVAANSDFKLVLADYGVTVPSLVKDKVASEAKITVDLVYQSMAKRE